MANADLTKMAYVDPVRKAEYSYESKLIVRRFSDVPNDVVEYITKASATYGSCSRALQVATAAIILSKKPIDLRYRGKNSRLTTVSYKLLPQTVDLITRYTPVFGTRGKVLEACSVVLQEIDKRIRSK